MSERLQVNASIDADLAAQLAKLHETRGVKPGAVARLALRFYVPLYQSGAGRTEHLDFLASLAADLATAPDLQADLEKFRTLWLRDPRAARAALTAARRAA